MGTLVFLLIITLVISIHEYGHYLACRAFGIPVTEFSVGLGRKLTSYQGNTEWSLRLIPIGGYIKPEEKAMDTASPFAKFVVAFAGPLANLLPLLTLATWAGKLADLLKMIGETYLLGFKALWSTLTLPFHMFNAEPVKDSVSGPIGIISDSAHVAHQSGMFMTVFVMFFVLNLSVALFNLIPIPPLDGGRVVIAVIEGVFGKSLADRVHKKTGVFGVLLLMSLFLIVTIRDIVRLF